MKYGDQEDQSKFWIRKSRRAKESAALIPDKQRLKHQRDAAQEVVDNYMGKGKRNASPGAGLPTTLKAQATGDPNAQTPNKITKQTGQAASSSGYDKRPAESDSGLETKKARATKTVAAESARGSVG